MTAPTPVFALTGQLAAGKSTLAELLVARWERGVHVDVDAIRELVTSGRADPIEWTDETTRQFALAVRASVALARVYADAGFAVAIEGAVDPFALQQELDAAGLDDRLVGVALHPDVAVARARNRDRTNKDFDTSVLDAVIERLDADIAEAPLPPGWHRLDNGGETPEQTAERIATLVRNVD